MKIKSETIIIRKDEMNELIKLLTSYRNAVIMEMYDNGYVEERNITDGYITEEEERRFFNMLELQKIIKGKGE